MNKHAQEETLGGKYRMVNAPAQWIPHATRWLVLADDHPMMHGTENQYNLNLWRKMYDRLGGYPIAEIMYAPATVAYQHGDGPYDEKGTYIYALGFTDPSGGLQYLGTEELRQADKLRKLYPDIGGLLLRWVRDNVPGPYHASYENEKLKRTVEKWQQRQSREYPRYERIKLGDYDVDVRFGQIAEYGYRTFTLQVIRTVNDEYGSYEDVILDADGTFNKEGTYVGWLGWKSLGFKDRLYYDPKLPGMVMRWMAANLPAPFHADFQNKNLKRVVDRWQQRQGAMTTDGIPGYKTVIRKDRYTDNGWVMDIYSPDDEIIAGIDWDSSSGVTSIGYLGFVDHHNDDGLIDKPFMEPGRKQKLQELKAKYPDLGMKMLRWVKKNLPPPYDAGIENPRLRKTLDKVVPVEDRRWSRQGAVTSFMLDKYPAFYEVEELDAEGSYAFGGASRIHILEVSPPEFPGKLIAKVTAIEFDDYTKVNYLGFVNPSGLMIVEDNSDDAAILEQYKKSYPDLGRKLMVWTKDTLPGPFTATFVNRRLRRTVEKWQQRQGAADAQPITLAGHQGWYEDDGHTFAITFTDAEKYPTNGYPYFTVYGQRVNEGTKISWLGWDQEIPRENRDKRLGVAAMVWLRNNMPGPFKAMFINKELGEVVRKWEQRQAGYTKTMIGGLPATVVTANRPDGTMIEVFITDPTKQIAKQIEMDALRKSIELGLDVDFFLDRMESNTSKTVAKISLGILDDHTYVHSLGFVDQFGSLLSSDNRYPSHTAVLSALKQAYPNLGQAMLKWVRDNAPGPYRAAYANPKLRRTVERWQERQSKLDPGLTEEHIPALVLQDIGHPDQEENSGRYVIKDGKQIVGSVSYSVYADGQGTYIKWLGLNPFAVKDMPKEMGLAGGLAWTKKAYPNAGRHLLMWVKNNLPGPYHADFANEELKGALRAEDVGDGTSVVKRWQERKSAIEHEVDWSQYGYIKEPVMIYNTPGTLWLHDSGTFILTFTNPTFMVTGQEYEDHTYVGYMGFDDMIEDDEGNVTEVKHDPRFVGSVMRWMAQNFTAPFKADYANKRLEKTVERWHERQSAVSIGTLGKYPIYEEDWGGGYRSIWILDPENKNVLPYDPDEADNDDLPGRPIAKMVFQDHGPNWGTAVGLLGFTYPYGGLMAPKDELVGVMQKAYPDLGRLMLRWMRDNTSGPWQADFANEKLKKTVERWKQRQGATKFKRWSKVDFTGVRVEMLGSPKEGGRINLYDLDPDDPEYAPQIASISWYPSDYGGTIISWLGFSKHNRTQNIKKFPSLGRQMLMWVRENLPGPYKADIINDKLYDTLKPTGTDPDGYKIVHATESEFQFTKKRKVDFPGYDAEETVSTHTGVLKVFLPGTETLAAYLNWTPNADGEGTYIGYFNVHHWQDNKLALRLMLWIRDNLPAPYSAYFANEELRTKMERYEVDRINYDQRGEYDSVLNSPHWKK